MRRLPWLCAVLVFGAVSSWAQHSPEVDALLDAFFAKDQATLFKHLPIPFQKAFSELPADKQTQIGTVFPTAEKLKHEGLKIMRSGDSEVLVTFEPPASESSEVIEVLLDKKISDGYESVLRLKARDKNRKTDKGGMIQVWMRYEDGEWRIHEIQEGAGDSFNLDDPNLLEQMTGAGGSSQAANEATAVGTLRTYNTAFVTYASTYEDLGFPASLDLLGPDENNVSEVSPHHAGLVDSRRATPPYELYGYRFTYQPGNSSMPVSAYTIVARPLEYGKTGTRSFFTDESGVIRFTSDDREPTRADPPLQ